MPTEQPNSAAFAPRVFAVSEARFEPLALDLFRHQFQHNPVYRAYCQALELQPQKIQTPAAIPFLPISAFKTHNVTTAAGSIPGFYFESSGTTGMQSSRHLVANIKLYEESFRRTFERFYGAVTDYCILGLLPSYLERGHSSLVYMVHDMVQRSHHRNSGFYLYDLPALANLLKRLEERGQRTILFGVTYALLDFAAAFPMPLRNSIIVETGGMKGRKKELLREEVHGLLKKSFPGVQIHSEYGMTELFSQAYATENNRFETPPWMRVLVRDEDDPFTIHDNGVGGINIIDLANIDSCCFIATEDAGRLYAGNQFEILGRLDHAEVRGCSLLAL